MKIESNRPVGPAGIRKDGKRSGSGFADALRPEEETSAQAVSGPSVLNGIDALFALQEVPDATTERSRAFARADEMLDRLEDLKRGLLLGSIGPSKLADLARLAKEGSSQISDPKVREVLQDIELRARVELAKLEPRDD
jgi:hypothetical protein